MRYVIQIQKVLNYIEQNLCEKITLDELAQKAFYSSYHFHRIFKSFTGETIKDYIRQRRLSYAAEQLLTTDEKILNLSFKCGFESQEAFTRAFKKMFNENPGNFRKTVKNFKRYEKMDLQSRRLADIMKDLEITPKIAVFPEIHAIGISCMTRLETSNLHGLWKKFLKAAPKIANRENKNVSLGICELVQDSKPMDPDAEFTYTAAVPVTSFGLMPDGMIEKTLPANRYLIFTHKCGSCKLIDMYNYIYIKFLPESKYELSGLYDFEYYDERFLGRDRPDSELDIYIPIK